MPHKLRIIIHNKAILPAEAKRAGLPARHKHTRLVAVAVTVDIKRR